MENKTKTKEKTIVETLKSETQNERILIYEDKAGINNSMVEPNNHLKAIQGAKNLYEERIGKKLRDNKDLAEFTSNNEKRLKSLTFDLVTEGSTDTTLYGMQVKKDKAFDLLELPEIDDIFQLVHQPAGNFETPVKHYYSKFLELVDGQIKLSEKFIKSIVERHRIYAVTLPEKARFAAVKGIADTLNSLIDKKIYKGGGLNDSMMIRLHSNEIRGLVIRKVIINVNWIKDPSTTVFLPLSQW